MESKSVETKAEAEKLNAFVKYQLKYERGNFKPVEPEPEPESQTTFESIMFLYLQAPNLPFESLSRSLYAVKTVLKKYGKTGIDQVDKKMMVEIQKMWTLSGNKGTTVKRKMAIFKAMLNWAYRNGIIEKLPIFPESPKCE